MRLIDVLILIFMGLAILVTALVAWLFIKIIRDWRNL